MLPPNDAKGVLAVSTTGPQAKIIIDGSLTGEVTPHSFDLEWGPHHVRLEQIEHVGSSETMVNVIPGKQTEAVLH
jgi:hypothetical protein